jgi:hypothetical protein
LAINNTRGFRAQWSIASRSQRAITVALLLLSVACLFTAFRYLGYIAAAGQRAVR